MCTFSPATSKLRKVWHLASLYKIKYKERVIKQFGNLFGISTRLAAGES